MTRRAYRWIAQHDEAAREFHARYVASRSPAFWPVAAQAFETMPRTARLFVIGAALLLIWSATR